MGLHLKTTIIWLLAALLLGDSLWRAARSNFNLGVLMMYCITAAVWVYALFHRRIDAFCAAGVGRVLKYVFFAGCGVFACLMVLVGVLGSVHEADGRERAVIVLGAAVKGDRVSGLLARRLRAAADYYAENPEVLVVVSGGQGPGESVPEAQAMRDWLVAAGVPAGQILCEDKSGSTEENFAFSKELLARRGITGSDPIAYATNRFHCYRAGKYAQAAGFTQVRAIPASIGVSSILPCYMREVLAVCYYWVFKATAQA